MISDRWTTPFDGDNETSCVGPPVVSEEFYRLADAAARRRSTVIPGGINEWAKEAAESFPCPDPLDQIRTVVGQ